MAQTFEEFIGDWMSERIVALAPDMDADDQDYMIRRRAEELRELCRQRGFQSALAEAARPHNGVANYVRHMYRITEESTRDPDARLQ